MSPATRRLKQNTQVMTHRNLVFCSSFHTTFLSARGFCNFNIIFFHAHRHSHITYTTWWRNALVVKPSWYFLCVCLCEYLLQLLLFANIIFCSILSSAVRAWFSTSPLRDFLFLLICKPLQFTQLLLWPGRLPVQSLDETPAHTRSYKYRLNMIDALEPFLLYFSFLCSAHHAIPSPIPSWLRCCGNLSNKH